MLKLSSDPYATTTVTCTDRAGLGAEAPVAWRQARTASARPVEMSLEAKVVAGVRPGEPKSTFVVMSEAAQLNVFSVLNMVLLLFVKVICRGTYRADT